MDLTIQTRQVEHVVIIRLSGRFSVFDSTLRQTAFDLIAKGERHFLIDLSGVTYMDHTGLGQICWIYTSLRNRGGDLKLLHPTPRIERLLQITKLDTVFESFHNEAEAIAAMMLTASASA